jgi:Uma2 family endonuclease
VQLGWLLNAKDKAVEIYRAGKDVEVLYSPASLSGEVILPGFILDCAGIMDRQNCS